MFHLIAGILLILYVISTRVKVNNLLQTWGFAAISFSHFSFYVFSGKITKGYVLLCLGIFILSLLFQKNGPQRLLGPKSHKKIGGSPDNDNIDKKTKGV